MLYKINTTATGESWEQIARQENQVSVRIFYNGKFINYFFEPSDVNELGLGAIFEMVDPDPDFVKAKKMYDEIQNERKPKLKLKPKKKTASSRLS